MKFSSYQIKGKGRGKKLGFSTINLKIPKNFTLKKGIYGVWVWLDKKKYLGALYYGNVPTFNGLKPSLEVHIIDSNLNVDVISVIRIIETEIIKYIRPDKKFSNQTELKNQIKKDINEIKGIITHVPEDFVLKNKDE